jgi:hypothetical protein
MGEVWQPTGFVPTKDQRSQIGHLTESRPRPARLTHGLAVMQSSSWSMRQARRKSPSWT